MNISSLFTANRVAAILTWLAGLAAFIVGIAQTLPGKWQNYALVAAGLLTKLVTSLHFMSGSQKYDALIAQSAENEKQRQHELSLVASGVHPYGLTAIDQSSTPEAPLSAALVSDADEFSDLPPESAITPDVDANATGVTDVTDAQGMNVSNTGTTATATNFPPQTPTGQANPIPDNPQA